MSNTALYLQTETSDFMMSLVVHTAEGNAIIIDGGQREDLPLLRELVAGRPVKAWIMTHPHLDHINAFIRAMEEEDSALMPEKVYYNFPTLEFVERTEPSEAWTLRDFLKIEPKIHDRAIILREGDKFSVDELNFTVLQAYEDNDPIVPARPTDQNSTCNENSMVFMMESPNKKVLILGDTGPLGGDRLYERHMNDLKCDIVQMAHHGHSGVGVEVYLMASPEACIWNCPEWLYNEPIKLWKERMWGTMMQRKWMEMLGVKTHYVAKDGNQRIEL